jgi:glucose/mannose-6-phosphate isomerase
MNLDDLDLFKKIDTKNMLAEIDGLPDQLQQAWELGQTLPLPDFTDIQNIVIPAMGDSAVGAELVTASVFSSIRLPVTVHRGYGLPAFASGQQTLVICISHSGNSEEVLDAFETAQKNKCSLIVISTGGLSALLKKTSLH